MRQPGYEENIEEELKNACIKALRYLSFGSKSKKALIDKLIEAGFSSDIAESAVSVMEDRGYVNDEKMARDYTEYAACNKKHGRRRIIQELKQKGINGETAEKAVSEYFEEISEIDSDPEVETALELLRVRLRQQRLELESIDYNQRQRLYGFLMRRGFGSGTVSEAFAKLRDEAED